MNPFEKNHLNNFIAGWYIDSYLCDSIVDEIELNPNKFSAGIKEYTNCDMSQFNKQLHDQYCFQLNNVVEEYKRLYPECYENLHIWGWTPPRLQKYEPGKAYRELHCENNGQGLYQSRHLVYMTYLNDIHDGGGTEFPQQDLIIPAKKGLTLIWPAGWTHHHRGIVSDTQKKFIITGWFCFYPDRPR